MNLAPERLFDEVERIDDGAQVGQPPRPELRELRDTDADRPAGIGRYQGIPHQGGCGLVSQHDRFPVKTMKANGGANLPHGIDDSVLTTPHAKECEHIDRTIDGPIDILVENRFKQIGLAFA